MALESPPLPIHPAVKSGVLDNGFSWVFLPNRSPSGRFEAHLQVFSGSGTSFEIVSCAFWGFGYFFLVSLLA